MTPRPSPIAALLAAYKSGHTNPADQLQTALTRVNGNASRNTYLALDPAWTLSEAQRQIERAASAEHSLPSTVCLFLLKIVSTLQDFRQAAARNFMRAISKRHQQTPGGQTSAPCGAIITGKTHLHQLAYGITGENRDYGDCLQPADPTLLTGGSSSGAAASIQEGSALAAIGTDTGGSVRAPAALCGLAGYRSSWASATGPEAIISRPPSIPSAGYAAISATSHFSPSHFSTCSRKNRLPQSPASACSPARSSKPAIHSPANDDPLARPHS